ncbi:MAG: RsmD family RNA methyltransferase [Actinobacteria bacterium]|jgi:16S rRNA (guanine966-N2)-methyltransferase|nr:RsmD family RNA methyltransferase [Actinomycetota bacterium]
MTRVIAGAARGRRLAVPPSGTRPTSDRVREAMFSSIDSDLLSRDLPWSRVRVLDLFAGTGAFGLEALSRGALTAVMVESSRSAVRVLTANQAVVGCTGGVIVPRDVRQWAGQPPTLAADVCFADPPYDWPAADLRTVLAALAAGGWLGAGALVVAERPVKDPDSPLPDSCTDQRRRTYGDTALWYGRFAGSEQPQPRAATSPFP